MNLYMQTTKIPAEKTASEVSSLLVKAGARQISMHYGENGALEGLEFTILVENRPLYFSLPARTDPVFQYINGSRKRGRFSAASQDRIDARRIAWRQLLRWVQAQLAMIQVGMVTPQEVFLPYWQSQSGGQTLYKFLEQSKFKQLTAGQ